MQQREEKQVDLYYFLRPHALIWIMLALALSIPTLIPPQLRALDFLAFYCGGAAVAGHTDPYRAMPLADCERHIGTGPLVKSGVIIPAPLPPYALAAFALFAHLPFGTAQHLFDLASVIALVLTLFLLQRVTGAQRLVSAFALSPLAWVVLALGQSVLIILAAIVVTGYLLQREHDGWATIPAAVAMLNPNIGLPVCVSLFLWRRKARLPLIGLASLFALISITILPPSVTLEYLSTVLPLHAQSEAGSAVQCSLAAVLVFLGVQIALALKLSTMQYVLMVILGSFAALGISQRLNDAASLAIIPPLFSVVGGTFIHQDDFLVAVPAALLLLQRVKTVPLVTGSLICLTPLWKAPGGLPGPILALAASAGLLILTRVRIAIVLIVAAGLSTIVYLSTRVVPHPEGPVGSVSSTAFAEASWALHEAANPMSALELAVKVPEWIGLVILCGLAISAATRRSACDGRS